jgi:hypothetical protein
LWRLDRFGPDVEQPLVCVGQLSLKGLHHLRADRVSGVGLHDALAGPDSFGRRPRVAVDQTHVSPPPREAGAEDENSRSGTDDGHPHEGSSSIE